MRMPPAALLSGWCWVAGTLLVLAGGTLWVGTTWIIPGVEHAMQYGGPVRRALAPVAGACMLALFYFAWFLVLRVIFSDPTELPAYRVGFYGRRVRLWRVPGLPWVGDVIGFRRLDRPPAEGGPALRVYLRFGRRYFLIDLDAEHFGPAGVARAAEYLERQRAAGWGTPPPPVDGPVDGPGKG